MDGGLFYGGFAFFGGGIKSGSRRVRTGPDSWAHVLRKAEREICAEGYGQCIVSGVFCVCAGILPGSEACGGLSADPVDGNGLFGDLAVIGVSGQ